MPRTKKVKALKPKMSSAEQIRLAELLTAKNEREETTKIAELEEMENQELEDWRMLQLRYRTKFPSAVLKRTIHEIKSGAADITLSQSRRRSRSEVRTKHVNDDEGYTTAESSRATSGERSRYNNKKGNMKMSRVTRSLSRNAKDNSYKTPNLTRNQSNPVGTITPKVKQNTPQVLLRRPKQGEMALSYQGSPLLTGTVVREDEANVNIPLADGNMLSLMPQRGLRTSQLPEVDADVRRQLQILRDNLIKVCKEIQ